MSDKNCGDHSKWWKLRKRFWRIIGCIVGFIILILLIILIIWLVLRPTKPRFYLQGAVVLQFNYTGPPSNLLSTVFQVTIASRNPNDRIGIYYDRIFVYAAYKNQQISLATALPPMYQGHNDVVIWSPYLFGPNVPVAPYLCDALTQDKASGFLILHVKIDGRIRWKVGSWTSDHYHLFVSCPAFLTFQTGRSGSDATVRFQQMSACSVEV
ncbi:NDR1/HIN1-like protein 1 [Musa acuminata AAA Group]|uniref:NDR1/HIN1-like protein 1 n=1 Tax=Musa acuminata AAA Group TaxID=214697 RepID=UPI0031D16534